MRDLAPVRVRSEGSYGDWQATCRVCGDSSWCCTWRDSIEFAYGHMAVVHPRWRFDIHAQ